MSSRAGYMISVAGESGECVLPEEDTLPRVVYREVASAAAAAKQWMEQLGEVRLAAYREVYPYDETSLEQELQRKGVATVGWATSREHGQSFTVTVQIISVYG